MRAPPAQTATLTIERAGGSEVALIPDARVVVRSANGTSQEAELGLAPLVVGSGPECGLVLKDGGVSRRHLEVALTPEGLLVRDLGSKNGTFVEGGGSLRVKEVLLPEGVELRLGDARLSLHLKEHVRRIPLHREASFGAAVGASVRMRALFALLDRAARSDETVLLLGESGTGKELLARAIHDRSPWKKGPFVVFDCGAVAPNLIEAELFGVTKGAFTGASRTTPGLFLEAEGGTLFLDEVGELSLELQPKLLRALESKQVRAVGGDAHRTAQVRVVAGTHRDLEKQMRERAFREDLYYRLAVVVGQVPALRERVEDIPLLVEHLLQRGTPPKKLGDLPQGTLPMLKAHHWPGNVRELRNVVSRLMLFPELKAEALQRSVRAVGHVQVGELSALPLKEARSQVVLEFERAYLNQKLTEADGNVSRAAEAMGISRQMAHLMIARNDPNPSDD